MIVRYLNLVRVSVSPSKAYPPLVVDPDAVLAGTISAKFLEPVTRRNSKIIELSARVDLDQLPPGRPLHFSGPTPHCMSSKDPLRILIGECLNHGLYNNVRR